MNTKILSVLILACGCANASTVAKPIHLVGVLGENFTYWNVQHQPDLAVANQIHSFSHGARLSYSINRFIAPEISYINITGLKKETSTTYSSMTHWLATLGFKVSPLQWYHNTIIPYVRGGIAYREVTESAYLNNNLIDRGIINGPSGFIGTGIDFNHPHSFLVNIDYSIYNSVGNSPAKLPTAYNLTVGLGLSV